MRKVLIISFVVVAFAATWSCQLNPSDGIAVKVEFNAPDIASVSTALSGTIHFAGAGAQASEAALFIHAKHSNAESLREKGDRIDLNPLLSENGEFYCILKNLSPGTAYNYMVSVVAGNDRYDSPVQTFTTGSIPSGAVDMGLSVLWGSCNLGAKLPGNYGKYYAWGETEPKSVYSWASYRWAEGSEDSLTKYNTEATSGKIDGIETLSSEDDAAHVGLGGHWRMPTIEEWEELYEHTSNDWTIQNGVNGWRFIASNGNSLFLPAAGSSNGAELVVAGEYGFYWSASLYTDSPDDAWSFSFLPGDHRIGSFGYRSDGQSIRPVKNK